MKRLVNMFGSWGLTAKLIGLFFLFGVTPMAIVGGIAYDASKDLEAGVGIRFQGVAQNIADKIDRNLFERYGDVQVFGLNRVVFNRSDWFKTSEETSDIVKAMCLGAQAVLIGRAYAYGLAAAGEPGVARAIEILRADVIRTMKLLGCASVQQLDRSYVDIPRDWRSAAPGTVNK